MIDLTPLDVRKKKGDFRRGLRGYEPQQVDDFLDVVADRLDALVRENQGFGDRIKRLEQQVAEYREREKALTEALVTAQEMREEMRAQVAREADLARRSAEQDAERILANAVKARDREEETLRRLHARQLHFLRTYRGFLEKEMAELASMAAAVDLSDAVGEPASAQAPVGAPAGPPAKPAPPPHGSSSPPPRAAETWEEWGLEPPHAPASIPPESRPAPSGPPTAPSTGAARPAPGRARGPAPAADTASAAGASPVAATGPAPGAAAAAAKGPAAGAAAAAATGRPGGTAPGGTAATGRPERTTFAAGVAGASVAGAAARPDVAPRPEATARTEPAPRPASPARPEPPGRAATTPRPPAAEPAPEAGEAELILSDADVLSESDFESDMSLMFGADAGPPGDADAAAPPAAPADSGAERAKDTLLDISLDTQDFFAGDLQLPEREAPPPPPARAPGSAQGLELDLVPEFEDFGEFGDLGDELSDDELGLPPPPSKPGSGGSDVQARRRDDPNDDPEDLLSTLFGDDR